MDPITGKKRLQFKPRSEWRVKRVRHLQIFPWRRWKAIQRRLQEVCHAARPPKDYPSRNQLYPTTLVSGLLYCGYCGREILLCRSNPQYDQRMFFCDRGRYGKDGCKLRAQKSYKYLAAAILDYVRGTLLTPAGVVDLVKEANAYIAQEAAKPAEDIQPLLNAVADIKRKRERLVDALSDSLSPDLRAIRNRIAALQRQIEDVETRIERARPSDLSRLPPLDAERIVGLLPDLRRILEQDVALAAPALRGLLGKVLNRSARISNL